MKLKKKLVVFNCFTHILLYCGVLNWIFSDKGSTYLFHLSSESRNLFWTLLILSIIYSGFICYLLLRSKAIGIKLAVFWNIFLGLFILIPWLGGYFLFKYMYSLDTQLNLLSVGSLLKGVISISLIASGMLFNKWVKVPGSN